MSSIWLYSSGRFANRLSGREGYFHSGKRPGLCTTKVDQGIPPAQPFFNGINEIYIE